MARTGSRPLTSNEPSASQPTASRLSREGLARLHDSMAAHVAAGRMPGLVALVACGGEVHVEAIGSPSFASGVPMARDAIFRIASLTKPVTAAATMSLVEEGLLRLDEPVDELVPELAGRRVLRAGGSSPPSTTTGRSSQ
jgi:CubicO group peptidase (beta-lactamase class C family)